VNFFEKSSGLDDNPVADETSDMRMENARRQKMKNGLFAADDDRVTGVVAALETDDGTCPLGEEIDDFPLAFVPPLGAHDDEMASHDRSQGV
jgi:hypothetical protein